MLYMIGTLALDTRPFGVNEMSRDADASIVAKPLFGAAPAKEFTGEGEDDITLSGQLLPTKIGGLTELEILHEMRRSGTQFPLMRGDGWRPGWYAITKISERHKDLGRDGVGFTVQCSISMTKVEPSVGAGQQIISGLLSLFGALER
ncbi:phage tail protein [Arvimicrobium flavum]|uniref:phage tail protein n=1 Tax=Arvimicrobium flavum TaxID=3393320 RepID=UPI00237AD053|nr:phage tail protein [Mesorhizobium shangrilense]